MSEQMEKLVEEIYLGLSAIDWGFQRKDAEEIIALMGKAYADGLPLPGEKGRWNPYDRKSFGIWLDELPGGEIFIALHKEENK